MKSPTILILSPSGVQGFDPSQLYGFRQRCVDLFSYLGVVECPATCVFYPACSTYDIFSHIWVMFKANVGKYSILGAFGYCCVSIASDNCNRRDCSTRRKVFATSLGYLPLLLMVLNCFMSEFWEGHQTDWVGRICAKQHRRAQKVMMCCGLHLSSKSSHRCDPFLGTLIPKTFRSAFEQNLPYAGLFSNVNPRSGWWEHLQEPPRIAGKNMQRS